MFGTMFRDKRQPGVDKPRRGHDERYTLETDFLDAVTGATRRLTLPDGRSLDVMIPPGTADGQILRLRTQGGDGVNGCPDGDALIEIHVKAHGYFERDGNDIRLRGRGVPAHGGQAAGELYATLRVVLGTPDAALEDFLRSWQPAASVDPRRAMEANP